MLEMLEMLLGVVGGCSFDASSACSDAMRLHEKRNAQLPFPFFVHLGFVKE